MTAKPKKTSNTARTLKLLRDHGYVADVVERILPRCFTKKDLFGFADIVAVREYRGALSLVSVPADGPADDGPTGTIYVQTTDSTNRAARRKKILANGYARMVLDAGNRIWLVTWRQKNPGGPWHHTVEAITLEAVVAYWCHERAGR
jgi:hypothetical protein